MGYSPVPGIVWDTAAYLTYYGIQLRTWDTMGYSRVPAKFSKSCLLPSFLWLFSTKYPCSLAWQRCILKYLAQLVVALQMIFENKKENHTNLCELVWKKKINLQLYLISVTSDLSKSCKANLASSRAGKASAKASSASFCKAEKISSDYVLSKIVIIFKWGTL